MRTWSRTSSRTEVRTFDRTESGALPVVSDPYFEYTTLLLPGNGTNGAQNNTFLDSSTNAFSITRNGNTTQGTFSPFSQTGWGLYQAAVPSDYLNFTTGAGTLFQFTGDYTIEAWVFYTALGSDTSLWVSNDGSANYHAFNIDATNYNLYLNSGSPTVSIAHGLTTNTWNHVAMVRSGSTVTAYTNGVSKGTTTNSSTNGYSSPTIARIGGGAAGSARYLSNVRIVKGTAVYTGAFTPSTTPLTAISGTSLLTCQANRFLDASSNALVPTVTGSPSVQAFSPFNPTAAWSASTNGGSGYFDGSGDYLGIPDSTDFDLNSTFTIDCWFYQPTAGDGMIFTRGGGAGGWSTSNGHEYLIFMQTGTFYWMWNNAGSNTQITVASPASGAWHHVAIGYNGTTTRVWIDGASVGTSTTGYTLPTTRNITRVGYAPSNELYFNGYISQVRVVKGTDVYGVSNTSITVPTAPLTAITNTKLLLSTTNAGIYDATSKNDLETVGNAQISTTQSKFGGSSMYFDGTGDYLVSNAAATNLYAFGAGDFTIELWVYFNSTSGDGIIYDSRGPDGLYPTLYRSTTSIIYYTNTAARITATSAVATGQWYHLAVARSGTSTKLFINGTQAGSTYTDSNSYLNAAQRPIIGAAGVSGYVGTVALDGYIDDLRVTRGYARYTSTFTPPTAAFPLL